MAEKLGLFVSSNKNLRHVIEITKAAEAAGKEVLIFFFPQGGPAHSGTGIYGTDRPRQKIIVQCGL